MSKKTTPYSRLLAREMLAENVTETLLELMHRHEVCFAELATRIGAPNKWVMNVFGGSQELTLRDVADMAFVLGYELEVTVNGTEHE